MTTFLTRRFAIFCVVAAALGLDAPALAADSPAAAPVYKKAPPAAPALTWTGFYIGGNAGWVQERSSGTSDFLQPLGGGLFASNPKNNSLSDSSFIGGGQLGYNWQANHFLVLGAEGDWDWLNTKFSFCRQTDFQSLACVDNSRGFETLGSQADWLATARGRLGLTVPTFENVMIYGTGGLAWGSIKTTESVSCLVGGCGLSGTPLAVSPTFTQNKSGWAAGAGVEGMVTPNWSVKAEWIHVDLGTLSNTIALTGTAGPQSVVWTHDQRFDMVRFGVNYRWH
jgi:outer membrane immunogenic protein